MDWHVALVVDTSGSIESSVIHAAMMAAILPALPALSVSFLAFSDEVIDPRAPPSVSPERARFRPATGRRGTPPAASN